MLRVLLAAGIAFVVGYVVGVIFGFRVAADREVEDEVYINGEKIAEGERAGTVGELLKEAEDDNPTEDSDDGPSAFN